METLTPSITVPSYSQREEIANSVSHGLGIILAIAGLAALMARAATHGDTWTAVGYAVFGVTLILLYTASTLYHSIPLPRAKAVLRLLDHSAIFLLIAGTYTPFTLVNLRGVWGWSLLAVIWGLALLGIYLRAVLRPRSTVPFVVLYVAMGWAVVVAAGPMQASVAPGGILLLFLGGVAYTSGIVFYGWRKLPYSHAIWHLFVLLGSVFHFFAILLYVTPLGTRG
jgi:hemolysin III